MENITYKNGQIISEQKGNRLTYYYKNGKVKATGILENNLMQSEWIFYRETGQLWQLGNFNDSIKHGHLYDMTETTKLNMMKTLWMAKKLRLNKLKT